MFLPTGELRITVEEGYSRDGRQAEFRDSKRASLEERLPGVLRGQLADWQLGNELDDYLAAMEASIPTLTSVKEQSAASAWLAWAKEYRQSINPLAKPLAMPSVPKPKPDELKPYLRGWSPYGASDGH